MPQLPVAGALQGDEVGLQAPIGSSEQTLHAVDALLALAHETRLDVFRLLVQAGPAGLPAGAISADLGVTRSTLSHHLAVLERAGILTSRHLRRQIFYACSFEGMRRLLDFLTNDCCQGHPDLCGFTVGGVQENQTLESGTNCGSNKQA